jgi:hypothetical protein
MRGTLNIHEGNHNPTTTIKYTKGFFRTQYDAGRIWHFSHFGAASFAVTKPRIKIIFFSKLFSEFLWECYVFLMCATVSKKMPVKTDRVPDR